MEVQIFEYEQKNKIRTVRIAEEIWFVALDVATILELENTNAALNKLENDEKTSMMLPDSLGKENKHLLINESGLYCLIFRSNKPEAKKFRHWVTNDVLPQIRKTGFYGKISPFHIFVRRCNENFPRLDRGYFSIISELYVYVYGRLEMLGYVIPEIGIHNREIRPDVSVGKLFPQWLKKHYPDKEQEFKTYQHKLPTDWIPTQAQRYFQERDPNAIPFLPKLIEAVK